MNLHDTIESLSQGKLEEFLDKFTAWLLKSSTNFLYEEDEYGNSVHGNEKLQQPLLFGLLCWSYSMSGIVILTKPKPAWVYRSNFWYETYGWMLLLLQSPLSFMADYINMTNDSMWHVYDRVLACTLFTLTISSLVCTHAYAKKINIDSLILDFIAISFAFGSFLMSSQAQSNKDSDAFLFWHNCWHCYPILKVGIYFLDIYVFDGLPNKEDLRLYYEKRKPTSLSASLLFDNSKMFIGTPSVKISKEE